MTTHYKGDLIAERLGDGSDYGVDITYVTEDQPLGTAGALSLLEPQQEPFLVMNGDILTRVNIKAMLDFHREQGAMLTVAVKQYDVQIPYGVVESQEERVYNLSEKPNIRFFVNAGIYVLEPGAVPFVPLNQPFDMSDLINKLIAHEERVVSFPIREYWLDIGQLPDYQQAQADVANEAF